MLEAQALSIHISSAHSLYDRPDFLASLEAQTNRSYQVVYVDLGAGKMGSDMEFESTRREVVRLRTFRNIGVVRGHNQAIALALSRWPRETWSERLIVLSRPEVAFDRRACEVFLNAFRADPTLMIAGPKVFWADAAAQTEGDWVELACSDQLHSAGIGLTRSRTLAFLGQGSQDTGQFDGGEQVLFLSDACVVVRASAFEQLMLAENVWLDPRLPSFFSILDLCWRMARQGVRPQLVPDARVWFAPQERARQKPIAWRERYLPSRMRAQGDDWVLRVVHAPWVAWSYLRYRVSRLLSGRYWEQRLTPEPGALTNLSDLKFQRPPDSAMPLVERRRWFIS